MCGLTATLATKLAAEGISCNIVAGTFHDHLFVDAKMAQQAINYISDLQKNASKYETLAIEAMKTFKE